MTHVKDKFQLHTQIPISLQTNTHKPKTVATFSPTKSRDESPSRTLRTAAGIMPSNGFFIFPDETNPCVICVLMTSDHSSSHFYCPTHPEPLLFSLLLGPSSARTTPFPDIIKM